MGAEGGHHALHIGHSVSAHVIDHHVDDVRAFGGLLARDGDHPVQVLGQEEVAECTGAGGVRAFANDEEGCLLADRHAGVQRCHGGFEGMARLGGRAGFRCAPADSRDRRFEHFGGGAAAATGDAGAEFVHEDLLVAREFGGRQPVAGLAVDELR